MHTKQCMALQLPPSLEELVIVNDEGPLGGLSTRLRQQILTEMRSVILVEYAPNDPRWKWPSIHFERISIKARSNSIVLWEVPICFQTRSPQEMEAARTSELQGRAQMAQS